jgi:CheY-like chemotaxis protein
MQAARPIDLVVPHAHRVLLVEDNDESAEAFEAVLTLSGAAVVRAPHGRRALEILSREHDFCLILLDLMMPVMDGYAFREVQRADPELSIIPIVVLSGVYQYGAVQLGLNVFLKKPVAPMELVEAVERNCAGNR